MPALICPHGHLLPVSDTAATLAACPVCGASLSPSEFPTAGLDAHPQPSASEALATGAWTMPALFSDGNDRLQTAARVPAPEGYEMLALIGRGGMGVVYKARQLAVNRVVALKMIIAGAQMSGKESREALRFGGSAGRGSACLSRRAADPGPACLARRTYGQMGAAAADRGGAAGGERTGYGAAVGRRRRFHLASRPAARPATGAARPTGEGQPRTGRRPGCIRRGRISSNP